jgi:hypothetical protein
VALVTITLPTGEQVSTKVIGNEHYQRLIPTDADGTQVSELTPLPFLTPQAQLDAFGRIRFSEPTTLGDFKQVVNTHNPLIWAEKTAGGGNSTYVGERAATRLNLGTSAGDSVIRQTKRYYRYSPGKSLLIFFTATFRTGQVNNIKRGGFFDNNNGLFFEQEANLMKVVVRSSATGSVVDTPIPQSNWNIDKMDGEGRSGILLDQSKAQIFAIDFEWLGVGRVRWGLVIAGKLHYVHETLNANLKSLVYMSTPNLPMRFETFNTNITGQSTTFDQICYSVLLEGSGGTDGIPRVADTGSTGKEFGNTNLTPVIALRLNSASIRSTIVDLGVKILATGNFRWQVILNPTITGGAAASWQSLANSVVQYDLAMDGTVSGGTVLDSGAEASKADSQQNTVLGPLDDIGLYADIDGVSDVIVLAAQKLSGGTDTAHATMKWRELI